MENQTITIELGGRVRTGSFEVSRGMVHVRAMEGSKSAQIGSTPPKVMARMLLREIIQDDEAAMRRREQRGAPFK